MMEKERKMSRTYQLFQKLLQPDPKTKKYLTIKDLINGKNLKNEPMRIVQQKVKKPKPKKTLNYSIEDFWNPNKIGTVEIESPEIEDETPDYTNDDAWDQYVWEYEARKVELENTPMTPSEREYYMKQEQLRDAAFAKNSYLRQKWLDKQQLTENERKDELNDKLKQLYKIIQDETENNTRSSRNDYNRDYARPNIMRSSTYYDRWNNRENDDNENEKRNRNNKRRRRF